MVVVAEVITILLVVVIGLRTVTKAVGVVTIQEQAFERRDNSNLLKTDVNRLLNRFDTSWNFRNSFLFLFLPFIMSFPLAFPLTSEIRNLRSGSDRYHSARNTTINQDFARFQTSLRVQVDFNQR